MLEYEDKVRIRACGLLVENNRLLLVELLSPVNEQLIWIPPGGGVEFGESLKKTVEREFLEETGLIVEAGDLFHINELIEGQFHAIEFYYLVKRRSGNLKLGSDPEYKKTNQILKSIEFKSKTEIASLSVSPRFIKKELWEELKIK